MSSKKLRVKTKLPTRSSKILLVKTIVRAANHVTDPLEEFTEYQTYKHNDLELGICFIRSADAEQRIKDSMFELLKLNMYQLYEQSSWGWDEQEKLAELTDKRARYLVVRDHSGKLVAFSHFRFEIDAALPVLYCYELQVHPDIQRKGVGQYMMQLLHLIALDLNLRKIVLTVFKCNTSAVNFYKKRMGFKLDETNPPDRLRQCYFILSKRVRKGCFNCI